MRNNVSSAANQDLKARLAEFQELPILYEDEPECDMGESNWHAVLEHILRYGLAAHLANQPRYRVFSNMNLHYQPKFPRQYVSPDVMVVTPTVARPDDLRSYRIGTDGPAPILTTEVLSEETAEYGDLKEKVYIYAMIGVAEYILADESGQFLPQRLLLKRLSRDRTWKDKQDGDGGVSSRLGFRLIWDTDGRLRVLDAATGKRYVRPDEAQTEAEARRQAEERIHVLEAELRRLQSASDEQRKQTRPSKRRKKS